MVERAGITVRTVSVGGTYNYEIAGAMAGVTEVLAGTYALMDYRYVQSMPTVQTRRQSDDHGDKPP